MANERANPIRTIQGDVLQMADGTLMTGAKIAGVAKESGEHTLVFASTVAMTFDFSLTLPDAPDNALAGIKTFIRIHGAEDIRYSTHEDSIHSAGDDKGYNRIPKGAEKDIPINDVTTIFLSGDTADGLLFYEFWYVIDGNRS